MCSSTTRTVIYEGYDKRITQICNGTKSCETGEIYQEDCYEETETFAISDPDPDPCEQTGGYYDNCLNCVFSFYQECDYEEDPQPATDCAGVVGGTAYNDPSCGCIGGTTGFATCPPDCDKAKKINERMANTTLSNQHALIQVSTATTNMEYGGEQNLTTFPPSIPSSFNTVNPRTDNNTGSFAPNFTWNSIDGYTIGVDHGHPSDGAPSPADMVNAFGNLSNPDLIAGGQTATDYYKANFTITTSTRYETFVVTVTDWAALGTLYNSFQANPGAANSAWIKEAANYLTNNPTATYGEYTAYASLKLYGSAISISKGSTNSTNFQPLKLDTNNKVATTLCP